MRTIPNLELHVTHGCNLACESCSHYSNQGHKGHLSLEDADAWMAAWSGRIAPQVFSLLGGEPTIHPQLAAFVPLVHRHWPSAHLRVVTNGFFLNRHPDLPLALREHPDATVYLSLHHESEAYVDQVRPAVDLLNRWHRDFGTKAVMYLSSRNWTRRYHGFGAEMTPFADGNARSSWEHCPAKTCPQLFEGAIWKCAPLAYLPMQHQKYGLSQQWDPYLAYRPLSGGCSDAQLEEFFDREDETTCGMCPAQPQRFLLPMPLARPGSASPH